MAALENGCARRVWKGLCYKTALVLQGPCANAFGYSDDCSWKIDDFLHLSELRRLDSKAVLSCIESIFELDWQPVGRSKRGRPDVGSLRTFHWKVFVAVSQKRLLLIHFSSVAHQAFDSKHVLNHVWLLSWDPETTRQSQTSLCMQGKIFVTHLTNHHPTERKLYQHRPQTVEKKQNWVYSIQHSTAWPYNEGNQKPRWKQKHV